MMGMISNLGMTAVAASTGNAYSAYLVGTNDTDLFDALDKAVTFGGYGWYVIRDDSISRTSGTLTLLMVNALGNSEFNSNDGGDNKYSTSTIRAKLLNYLNSDNNLWAVSDAIKPVTVVTYEYGSDSVEYDRTPVPDKLWLPSESEVKDLSDAVRDCHYPIDRERVYSWWLRSNVSDRYSARIVKADGKMYISGNQTISSTIEQTLGIRPAPQLNLSAVTFNSETQTFTLKSAEHKVVLTGGGNAAVSGRTEQITTGAMSAVTYNANSGFFFEPFTDIVSNGITVKRINDSQVTVFGTPSANVRISVPDARSTTLSVSFDANSGTGSMANIPIKLYSSYKLPACTFTPPEGKEFNGWDKGAVGTTITVTADTTLVARWKRKKNTPSQGAFSDYVPDDTDLTQDLLEKKVKFAEIWWYIIADNSTSKRNGTLTLLSVDPVDSGKFGKRDSDFYMGSLIREQLRMLSVHDWRYVLANTSIECDGRMRNIGQTLYLLSTEEAQNLPCGDKVRKCNKADGAVGNYWWLRSQGTGASGAAYVEGDTGKVISSGASDTQHIYGVRPALQLDLSKVYFSTNSNTFSLEPFTYSISITGGSNATRSGGAAPQTVADGNAMNTVTYTANKGFHFEPFTDITSNGVTVSRTGDTVVTVSGTPTADVRIAVPNAVAISTTTPEPGTDDSNPSQTTGSEDNGSSNTEQAQYNQDSEQIDTAEVQPAETIDKTQKGTTLSKPQAGKKSVTLFWKKQTAKGIKGY